MAICTSLHPNFETLTYLRSATCHALWLLLGPVLAGCAGVHAGAQADCSGLSGSYRDRADPSGESLARFLLGRVAPKVAVVCIDAADGRLVVAAGPSSTTLPGTDFVCDAPDELRLAREETSVIHAPPLIDQTRTTSYVLRGRRGKALVLNTYSRTTARPYGLPFTGPLQLESTTMWQRESH